MTCDQSVLLIASAIEGGVAPRELDVLISHLQGCPACLREAEAQNTVKRIVASRPAEPLPDGFAHRLAARLEAEGSRGVPPRFNWRKWIVRLLFVAAGPIHSFRGLSTWQAETNRHEFSRCHRPSLRHPDLHCVGHLPSPVALNRVYDDTAGR